ncbi:MAG: MFS transporter [Desulforhopalus sp.]
MKNPPLVLLRVFLPFAAGYFLSYLYRAVNAVLAPDLIADIGVGPSALGMLTAVYFISFASFQLPLGVLLDRYGPRNVEAGLLLFAGLGAYIFANAEGVGGLIAGRVLIGFGVSACLMAAFKAYTLWFSREKWPLIYGLQMACGGLGALCATSPIEKTLLYTDWRGVFTSLCVLTLLTAGAVFLVVPQKKGAGSSESLQAQMRGIREVFTSRIFWRTAPLTTMSQAAFLAIQGLWAGPWLSNVAHLDRTAVANVLFWVAVSMVTGFIILGGLAERLSRLGISPETTAVTGMLLFIIVQLLLLVTPADSGFPLWLAFGFFGTSGIVAYSALSQSFPAYLSGRVTTAVNLLVFIAAFIGQWAIGGIIDLYTIATVDSLSPAGFRSGFGLMLFLETCALIHFFREKRNQIDDGPGVVSVT